MKLDNNIINWINPKKTLPKISNGYGHGLSEHVLTLLADNGKTGGINRYVFNFYDYVLQEWNVKEVIAWTYIKTYKHLQDYHIDEDC